MFEAAVLRRPVLRRLLIRRNLRQSDLARISQLSPATISLWLSGQRHPSALARQRLLAGLGADFDTLFTVRHKAQD